MFKKLFCSFREGGHHFQTRKTYWDHRTSKDAYDASRVGGLQRLYKWKYQVCTNCGKEKHVCTDTSKLTF